MDAPAETRVTVPSYGGMRRWNMIGLLGLAATVAAIILGYANARRFVRTRLRYVDAIQRKLAPWAAGAAAAVVVTPLAWLLPAVGIGSVVLFGVAIGTGVAHGARDVRRAETGLLRP